MSETHSPIKIYLQLISRTDVKATQVDQLILEKRRVTIRNFPSALELSIGAAHNNVCEQL
jgi:hypothetical protein